MAQGRAWPSPGRVYAAEILLNPMGLVYWFNKESDSRNQRLGTFMVNFTPEAPEPELPLTLPLSPYSPPLPHSFPPHRPLSRATNSDGGGARPDSSSTTYHAFPCVQLKSVYLGWPVIHEIVFFFFSLRRGHFFLMGAKAQSWPFLPECSKPQR